MGVKLRSGRHQHSFFLACHRVLEDEEFAAEVVTIDAELYGCIEGFLRLLEGRHADLYFRATLAQYRVDNEHLRVSVCGHPH